MEVNTVVETVLYILCTLIIQLQQLPDRYAFVSDDGWISWLIDHLVCWPVGPLGSAGLSVHPQSYLFDSCLSLFVSICLTFSGYPLGIAVTSMSVLFVLQFSDFICLSSLVTHGSSLSPS